MTKTEIATKCPFCGRISEVSTSMNNAARPGTGSISICWGCGKPSIFDFNQPGNVRRPTFAEYLNIAADPEVQKAIRVYQVARTPREAIRMMNSLEGDDP